jgi:hypothetical protein
VATAILLPAPQLQFCDADGKPYAGGSIATYVPGTTTPKATWVDPGEAALNTNPVILDAAGRCILYGDGDYRLILRDAAGNLIYDQLSSTVVSAAMMPVVSAPTIADAVHLLGLDDTVTAAELASAVAVETARAEAAEGVLTTNLAAEVARAEAAEADLQTQIDAIPGAGPAGLTVQGGTGNAGTGHVRITYGTPYATCISCVASPEGSGYTSISILMQFDNTGADIYVVESTNAPASANVAWIAVGIV